MDIYQYKNSQLAELSQLPFKLEKDLQQLVEANMQQLIGYKFIKSEFIIKDKRIDSLAYDTENKAFVVVEYKRGNSYSVIDQGFTYLQLMLEYKSEFILEYNESQHSQLRRSDIDWSQSKVIFIAPEFSDFQRQATNFKDLPIELYTVKQFANHIIAVDKIKKSKAAPAFKEVGVAIAGGSAMAEVTKTIKVYSEEMHLADKTEQIKNLYESFKTAILNLNPAIDIVATKLYLAFKLKNRNITDIAIQQKSLKLFINLTQGQLDDPKGLARDMSNTGHWGNGDYQLIVSDTQNVEYIMSLIKQAV